MEIQAQSRIGNRDTSPFILTSGSTPGSIAFTGGVPGPAVSLNSLDLTNTLRVPIELQEICLAVDEPGAAANQGTLYGGLEIDLRLGSRGITQGFTPVAALAKRRESSIEITGAAAAFSPDRVRWILPRPLIVASGEGLQALVRANSSLTYPAISGTVRFVLTAFGRRLPTGTQVPAKRAIPYASGGFFITANRPLGDFVFRNVFTIPLHVTCINARPIPDVANPPVIAGNWTIEGYSAGRIGTRTLALNVPGNNLFGQRLSWEESFDMQDNDSLLVKTDTITGLGTAVCLTGWREE